MDGELLRLDEARIQVASQPSLGADWRTWRHHRGTLTRARLVLSSKHFATKLAALQPALAHANVGAVSMSLHGSEFSLRTRFSNELTSADLIIRLRVFPHGANLACVISDVHVLGYIDQASLAVAHHVVELVLRGFGWQPEAIGAGWFHVNLLHVVLRDVLTPMGQRLPDVSGCDLRSIRFRDEDVHFAFDCDGTQLEEDPLERGLRGLASADAALLNGELPVALRGYRAKLSTAGEIVKLTAGRALSVAVASSSLFPIALELAEQCKTQWHDLAAPREALAAIALSRGTLREAESHYRELADLAVVRPDTELAAWSNVAAARAIRSIDAKAATRYLEAAFAADPRSEEIAAWLLRRLEDEGRWTDACEVHCAHANMCSADAALVHYTRAAELAVTVLRDTQRAQHYVELALANPTLAIPAGTAARLAHLLAPSTLRTTTIDRGLAHDPNDASLLLVAVHDALIRGDVAQATVRLHSAASTHPAREQGWLLLRRAQVANALSDEAAAQLSWTAARSAEGIPGAIAALTIARRALATAPAVSGDFAEQAIAAAHLQPFHLEIFTAMAELLSALAEPQNGTTASKAWQRVYRLADKVLPTVAGQAAAHAAEHATDVTERHQWLGRALHAFPASDARRTWLFERVTLGTEIGAWVDVRNDARMALTLPLASGEQARVRTALADALRELGDEQGLAELLTQLPADATQSADRQAAAACLAAGSFEQAIKYCERALAGPSLDATTRLDLRELLARAAWAARRWDDLLQLAPTDPNESLQVKYYVGRALLDAHRYDEAAATLVGEVEPASPLAYAFAEARADVLARGGNIGEAAMVLKEALTNTKVTPSAAAASWHKVGEWLRRINDDAEAQAAFEQALNMDTRHMPSLDSLDAIATKQQAWENVAAILSRKVAAASGSPRRQSALLHRLAALWRSLGRDDIASLTFARAAELVPTGEHPSNSAAPPSTVSNPPTHLQPRVTAEVVSVINQAAGSPPKADLPPLPIGEADFVATVRTLRDGPLEAFEAWLTAAAEAPADRVRALACLELGILYRDRLAQPERSADWLTLAYQTDPTLSAVWLPLATAHEAADDIASALSLYERVAQAPDLAGIADLARNRASTIGLRPPHRAADKHTLRRANEAFANGDPMQAIVLATPIASLAGATQDEALTLLDTIYEQLQDRQAQADVVAKRITLATDAREKAHLWLRLASVARQRGDHATQLSYLLQAHAAQPDDVRITRTLRDVAMGQGEWRLVAQLLYDELRNVTEDRVRGALHLELGLVFEERLDDHRSATLNYEQALAYDPTIPTALARLARRYEGHGRLRDAARLYRDAAEVASSALAKEYRARAEACEGRLLLYPRARPDNAEATGLAARLESTHDATRVDVAQLLWQADPGNNEAFLILADAARHERRPDRLFDLVAIRVGHEPDKHLRADLWYDVGHQYDLVGDSAAARRAFDRALIEVADHDDALRRRAEIAIAEGDWPTADVLHAHLRPAAANLSLEQLFLRRAFIVEKLGRIREALALTQAAAQSQTLATPDVWLSVARHAAQLAEWDTAIHAQQVALRSTPATHHTARVNLQLALAQLHFQAGAHAASVQVLEDILSFDPLQPDALEQLAMLRTASGEAAAAARHLRVLVDNTHIPEQRASHMLSLAGLLSQTGNPQEADDWVLRAADIAPQDTSVLHALLDVYWRSQDVEGLIDTSVALAQIDTAGEPAARAATVLAHAGAKGGAIHLIAQLGATAMERLADVLESLQAWRGEMQLSFVAPSVLSVLSEAQIAQLQAVANDRRSLALLTALGVSS